MRDIAVRSHVALGGIYNHFSSKERIFRTIIEERHPLLEILPLLGAVEGDSVETTCEMRPIRWSSSWAIIPIS